MFDATAKLVFDAVLPILTSASQANDCNELADNRKAYGGHYELYYQTKITCSALFRATAY